MPTVIARMSGWIASIVSSRTVNVLRRRTRRRAARAASDGDRLRRLRARRAPVRGRARRRDGARAGAAVEDRLRRPELQGSCGRGGKALPAEPLLFFKPSTRVIDPGAAIQLPPGVGRVDHEAELAIVIGRRAHRCRRADAWDYVFGITCLNDVTARDMQNKESQYTRCKGFDTFAPIGPCIADRRQRRAARRRRLGQRRAAAGVDAPAQLIFPIEHLIEFITFVMTLEPGDVISTGTPPGVGPLKARRRRHGQGRGRRRAHEPG